MEMDFQQEEEEPLLQGPLYVDASQHVPPYKLKLLTSKFHMACTNSTVYITVS